MPQFKPLPSAHVFGRVAVLYGGHSAERAVSLKSGQAVYQGLRDYGIDAHLLDTAETNSVQILTQYDRAFIVLHGRGGEDGQIQAVLNYLNIPYTGSGMTACALGMDKLLTKLVWRDHGLPVLPDLLLSRDMTYETLSTLLGSEEMVVKPVLEGSSVGVSKVFDADSLRRAYELAGGDGEKIMAEPWINGREFSYSIVGDDVLPGVEVCASQSHVFYDYDAKYHAEDTRYLCPAPIDSTLDEYLRGNAFEAFRVLGASGWGRVDYLVDNLGQAFLLEINTVPGMTNHSLVPLAAKSVGIDFQTLVVQILSMTLS